MYCEQCGEELGDDAEFCTNCGHDLQDSVEDPQATGDEQQATTASGAATAQSTPSGGSGQSTQTTTGGKQVLGMLPVTQGVVLGAAAFTLNLVSTYFFLQIEVSSQNGNVSNLFNYAG